MQKSIWWWLFQPYKFFVVIPVAAVATLVFGTLAVLLSYVLGQRIASLLCGQSWARVIGYASLMNTHVKGRDNIDPKQSYVIVSNHQSAYDIIVIYGWLGIDFKWVMKQEMRKIPVLGYACYRIGHIFIDRKNKKAAIGALEDAKKRIQGGTSVFFFPEGTRTQSSALKPFKKGAFKMALDLGLPILPVTLNGVDKIMPTKTINLMPGSVEMIVHPSIDTEGCTEDDIERLMQESFEQIDSVLEVE